MEETKAKTSIVEDSRKKEKEGERTKDKKRRMDGNECRSRDTERQGGWEGREDYESEG